MSKMTIKELLSLSVDWTVQISKFYEDFRDKNEDVSFRKLLATMIEQEEQYTEYYKENLNTLNLNLDFVIASEENIEFNDSFEEIQDTASMTKIDFLKKAVHYQDISVKTCYFLKELSKTDRGKQIFKEMADEGNSHMFIFRDHLELEEFIISFFLLVSIPLFSGIAVSLFFKQDFIYGRFKKVFFMGMFFFVLAQVLLLLIGFFYKINYDKSSLFIYFWFNESFIVLLAALAGYFLMLRKGIFRQDSYREFPFIFSYASGFFALSGLSKIVNSLLKFDAYILFIYPVIRIVLLLLFSILIIEASTRRGYVSILIYSLFLPLSIIIALVPWLYYINYFPAAIGITLAVIAGALVLFYLFKKDYIRN